MMPMDLGTQAGLSLPKTSIQGSFVVPTDQKFEHIVKQEGFVIVISPAQRPSSHWCTSPLLFSMYQLCFDGAENSVSLINLKSFSSPVCG